MKQLTKKTVLLTAASCAALIGVGTGMAMASVSAHKQILLKGPDGQPITKNVTDGSAKAFSMKNTCFGTTGCHGTGTGVLSYTYDDIEKHSYHAQLGANEIRGFNPFNIDSADAFRSGAGPQGKNWVQSPGHVGSW
ncbi:cytochrome C [Geomonas edaphica]|uniref:cytochrome C n=1 Tax=Geomonas edaphica TaxID=2570226 RepID=UPI001FED1F7D|nr:cytochrome C [Geomonas edaphica]